MDSYCGSIVAILVFFVPYYCEEIRRTQVEPWNKCPAYRGCRQSIKGIAEEIEVLKTDS